MSSEIHFSWNDPGTGKIFSFNEEGMFVDSDGKGPQKGFKNDNNFGDWLHAYIQQNLMKKGLVIREVEKNVPIFHTPDALNSAKKLLVLISGTGRIMAGCWSVGVCAYHGLKAGSVFPCLEEAKKRGMEVIILNPNHPKASSSHSRNVFANVIIPSNPERVWIIAHSMGGASTCSIISSNPKFCIEHVPAFALTDGLEGIIFAVGYKINKWSHLRGINWVRSNKEINTDLMNGASMRHRSAATNDHPLTTFKAFPYIWEFFDENGADKESSPPLPESFIA